MKKIISAFLLLMICFSYLNVSYAMKITGSKKFDLPNYVVMNPTISENANGLSISIDSAYTGMFLANIPNNSACYYYKHGLFGDTYALGVTGLRVTLTNTTNQLLVIKWSESAYTMGSYTGLPFLDGMKYIDAGNPSALADNILPPGARITRNVFQSNVKFANGRWIEGYQFIKEFSSLRGSLYLKVTDQQGNISYASAQTSLIYVPESAIDIIMND